MISGRTRLYGVVGHPGGHSLSPAMHNAAFAALGLDAAYVALPVPPGALPEALRGAHALGFQGLNVTVPHKPGAAALCRSLDETARLCGAANTLRRAEGGWDGFNTDAPACRELARAAGAAAGQRALVLGAGGAALACAWALAALGLEVRVAARRPEAAAAAAARLAAAFPRGPAGAAVAWGEAGAEGARADLGRPRRRGAGGAAGAAPPRAARHRARLRRHRLRPRGARRGRGAGPGRGAPPEARRARLHPLHRPARARAGHGARPRRRAPHAMSLRYLTAGESHGPALCAIAEGFPAGLTVDFEAVNAELARRQKGYGRGGRQQIERDEAQFLSGLRGGVTLGSPIALVVWNKDHASWKDLVSPYARGGRKFTQVRPGHADLPGALKYGFDDARDALERASARSTAATVGLGALARQLLLRFGVRVASRVTAIGERER